MKCYACVASALDLSPWWNASSAPFFTTAGEYAFSIARHFLGHASTHALHAMQRSRLICQSFDAFTTVMAAVGHFFWHIPQKMHLSISMETLPRVFLKNGRFSNG
jgi:hypothetical protein